LRNYLLYATLAVALTVVGLTLRSAYRIRQTEEAVAELRRLAVNVTETYETDEFWRTFARAVGLSTNNELFERSVYTVTIDGERLSTDTLHQAALRAATRLPDLIDLRISNVAEVDDGLGMLAGCTELRNISFYRTGVTDTGLSQLRHCKRLQSVQVGECPVTDEGIRFLCGLPSMRGLSCISCPTQTTVDNLLFASPNASMPQSGQPLTITGRVRIVSPVPVSTAVLRFFVSNLDVPHPAFQTSAVVTLDSANQASFTATAKNGGGELQPGRNIVYISVILRSTPAIQFHFERTVPVVPRPD